MKFTVFGGGGFIGSAIVDRLLAGGHGVRVFERPRVAPYREFRTSGLSGKPATCSVRTTWPRPSTARTK